jgi:hypothetical protein
MVESFYHNSFLFPFYPFLFTPHPSFSGQSVTPHNVYASLYSRSTAAPSFLMQAHLSVSSHSSTRRYTAFLYEKVYSWLRCVGCFCVPRCLHVNVLLLCNCFVVLCYSETTIFWVVTSLCLVGGISVSEEVSASIFHPWRLGRTTRSHILESVCHMMLSGVLLLLLLLLITAEWYKLNLKWMFWHISVWNSNPKIWWLALVNKRRETFQAGNRNAVPVRQLLRHDCYAGCMNLVCNRRQHDVCWDLRSSGILRGVVL